MIEKGWLFFPTGVASRDSRSIGSFFVVLGVDGGDALLAGTNVPPGQADMDTIGCCPQCDIQCCVIGADARGYPFRYSVLMDRQNMGIWKCAHLNTRGSIVHRLSEAMMKELKRCAYECRSIPPAILNRFLGQ